MTKVIDGKYDYYAFISYKREDEKWAKWLQKKLESYKLPTTLRNENPDLPNKIRPVFRDQSDLSAGNLKNEIENGLNGSKHLIVICSPRSAKSPWVSKEVLHFIKQNKEDFIIPFIIGGIPNASNPEEECFPEGLRQLNGEKELLGVNINEMGRDAAAIKVIARMFGIRFDSLWQRYEKEKKRKLFTIGTIAALLIFLSISIAGYIANQNSLLQNANEKILVERDRANSERNRAKDANIQLSMANDSIRREKDRANSERDRAEDANKKLSIANDSIKEGYNKLNEALGALESSNMNLAKTNHQLTIEKDRVSKALLQVTYEQINSKSESIRHNLEAGHVLHSLNQIINILPSDTNNLPLVENALDILNKGYFDLTRSGYKIIDITPSDSLFSNDGRWSAYNINGEYFAYDLYTQMSYKLPGEDRIDYNRMFFTDNGYLYGIGCDKCYQWDVSTQQLINAYDISGEFNDWVNDDDSQDLFTPTVISNIKPFSYFHKSMNKTWGNFRVWHFDSFDTDEYTTLITSRFNNNSEKIQIQSNYKLNKDYNFCPIYPNIAYRNDSNRIKVLDLKNNDISDIFWPWEQQYSALNKIICLNSGNEVVINSMLYSRRKINKLYVRPTAVFKDSLSMSLHYPKFSCPTQYNIEYNDSCWSLIDSNNKIKLYVFKSSDEEEASGFNPLLVELNGEYHKINPYIDYTMGNGSDKMLTKKCKIINDNQILLVSSQGAHSVYDLKNDTRRFFSYRNYLIYDDYSHESMYICDAAVVNNSTHLLTSSVGGVFSLYDIRTGSLLCESSIKLPQEYIDNGITLGEIKFVPYHISENGQYIYGCLYGGTQTFYVCYQLPSITDFINFARTELQNFWINEIVYQDKPDYWLTPSEYYKKLIIE